MNCHYLQTESYRILHVVFQNLVFPGLWKQQQQQTPLHSDYLSIKTVITVNAILY